MMDDPITLSEILPLGDLYQYKLHLSARNNDGVSPLNEYVENRENWLNWNRYKGRNNVWNRPFIFSVMEFYPISNAYLFGGVFRIKERNETHYVIEEDPRFSKWEGRLIVKFTRKQGLMGRAFLLESHIEGFSVHQLLPERYSGESFCGFDRINHMFSDLKVILRQEKPDWKGALMSAKGVYLIFDTFNGKAYVGSAYGDWGIWSRLQSYIFSGHGGNDELIKVIAEKTIEYALKYFKFTILEVFPSNVSNEIVLSRESHWKNVLKSREFGYNGN